MPLKSMPKMILFVEMTILVMVTIVSLPSSAYCWDSNVVLRFFIFFDISQNMIIFARFKSSSEAQLNFLREPSTLGYVRHYDLDRSCN